MAFFIEKCFEFQIWNELKGIKCIIMQYACYTLNRKWSRAIIVVLTVANMSPTLWLECSLWILHLFAPFVNLQQYIEFGTMCLYNRLSWWLTFHYSFIHPKRLNMNKLYNFWIARCGVKKKKQLDAFDISKFLIQYDSIFGEKLQFANFPPIFFYGLNI